MDIDNPKVYGDTFISDGLVLSSVRFTEIDQNIAKEVQKLGKPFFFARTKMDNAIRDDQRKKKKNFNPTSTADQIREDCLNKLVDEHREKIFLISNLLEDELTAASIVPGLGSFVGASTSWTTCYCSLMTMLSANIQIAKSSILVIQWRMKK